MAFGATTLTGNASFDPAAGTSLLLPAISDGGAGYGLTKTGPGTLTITGLADYSGITRVEAGTLNVVGSLAHADSAHVQIAVSPTAPTAFAADTPVVQSLVVLTGSYAGHGSQIGGDLHTAADIMAGTNSGAFTGGDATLTMQWRQRTAGETSVAQGGAPQSPPLANAGTPLISDVLLLAGMGSGPEPAQTDPFVLQMSYDPSQLADEAAQAAAGAVFLGWLNPTDGAGGVPSVQNAVVGGGGTPLWQNAVTGNFDNNATPEEQNFAGSFAEFQAAHGMNPSDYIGAWGVDTGSHEVWAVVDHNSQFAVVPEPTSLVLACLGLIGLGLMRRIR